MFSGYSLIPNGFTSWKMQNAIVMVPSSTGSKLGVGIITFSRFYPNGYTPIKETTTGYVFKIRDEFFGVTNDHGQKPSWII